MQTHKAYITGFFISIVLTLAAFVPVIINAQSNFKTFSHNALIAYVLVLAFIQLCAQLTLFLHLGREQKPHWNLSVFMATIGLVFIVVVGSLWIMAHLNYNMTPDQINTYIKNSDAF
ncbi:MAG: cytochrome o ubiquinol oxidase subunit [Candidatus Doudnabacteria bacterium]|nr:cytochrome o ubiquinol oxidase subunit [Candidatus Doudnabacteria bacterium]